MITETNRPKATAPRTPRWVPRFLDALRQHSCIAWAAQAASITRRNAYIRRGHDPAFRAAWDSAREAGLAAIEAEVHRRALAGNETLLKFLLKALPPNALRCLAEVPPALPATDNHLGA